MRSSRLPACAAVIRPCLTRRSSGAAARALPFSAVARLTSISTHSMPRPALAVAIPPPIMPAPRIPILPIFAFGTPAGRALSLRALAISKKPVRTIALVTGWRIMLTRYLLSTRRPTSMWRWQPS